FAIESKSIDGNDPEVSYREIAAAMEYVRTERKPFLLEALVSRLYGHSSASGANVVVDEADCPKALQKKLQERKLRSRQPLDERGIVGAAIGLGLAGCRNVGEIQFCDYAYNTIDLLKLAGLQTWSTNGDWNVPMTILTPVGAGIRGSIYHSHSFDATATHIPGFKIAIPSTPRDAYGLLLSCIVDPNPCFFLVPKALMRVRSVPGEEIPGEPGDDRALSKMIDAPLGDRARWQPQWPDTPDVFIPFGEGRTVRRGRDLTVVSYGRTLPLCKKA